MNKNIRNGLIVVGVAALIYILLTSNKPVTLTEQEKVDLFEKARGYRGGVAPSLEMQQQFEKSATEAQKKIDELKLRSEYEAYLKSKENEALPQ